MNADDLMNAAREYSEMVIKNLVLDPSYEPPKPGTMADATMEEFLTTVSKLLPQMAPWAIYGDQFLVHYLFPNMTEDQRDLLSKCRECGQILGGTRADEAKFEECKKKVRESGIEEKATAVQMEIIEKHFLNWDGY